MTRLSSASSLALTAVSFCAAAAALAYACLSGTSSEAVAASACGALFLFLYSSAGHVLDARPSHSLVSGEISRALFFAVPALVFSGKSIMPLAAAGALFLFFEVLIFSTAGKNELFFSGIVSHAVLAVILSFLALRGSISADDITPLLAGPLRHCSSAVMVISAGTLAAALFLIPQAARTLTPVSLQTMPFTGRMTGTLIVLFRKLTLFAAVLLCGFILVPFETVRAASPVMSRISALFLYLAVAFASAAAIHAGAGVYALLGAAAASYIRFLFHTRRKTGDAHRQRSFMHSQRRTGS